MARPTPVREIPFGSLGSHTRTRERFKPHPWLYHAGQAARWVVIGHPKTAGLAGVFGVGWWILGGREGGLLLVGAVLLTCLTIWLLWRRGRGEAASFLSPRVALWEARQKKRLEAEWPVACRTVSIRTDAESHGGVAPPLSRVRSRGYGTLTAETRCSRLGVLVDDLQRARGDLAEVLECHDLTVTRTGPGRARLTFHWVDPLGRVLPLADLPTAPPGRVAYGVRQDGTPAHIVPTQSLLAGGLTRKGKSNIIRALLFDCVRRGIPVDLYISDAKNGVEFTEFEKYLMPDPEPGEPRPTGRDSLIRVKGYARDPREIAPLVERVEEAMRTRGRIMRERGMVKIETPTVEFPLVILLIDELIPLESMLREGAKSPLSRIAYMGAAAAYVMWACTQSAHMDTIGRLRTFIPQRICVATKTAPETNCILGDGAEQAGAKCSDLREAGLGYSWNDEDQRPSIFRAAMVTAQQAKQIAAGKLPDGTKPYLELEEIPSRANRRTTLYRWFDPHGDDPDRPMYIGVGFDALARAAQHIEGLRAFTELAEIRWTQEHFDTRRQALRAEADAIKSERPVFNKQHNGRSRRTRIRA